MEHVHNLIKQHFTEIEKHRITISIAQLIIISSLMQVFSIIIITQNNIVRISTTKNCKFGTTCRLLALIFFKQTNYFLYNLIFFLISRKILMKVKARQTLDPLE